MKTQIKLVAPLLLIGVLAVAGGLEETYRFTLRTASAIGATELQPGDYKVAVGAPKVVLTELKTGKTIELEAKVERVEKKFDTTEIHSRSVDGANRISEIRIGGSKTKIIFE